MTPSWWGQDPKIGTVKIGGMGLILGAGEKFDGPNGPFRARYTGAGRRQWKIRQTKKWNRGIKVDLRSRPEGVFSGKLGGRGGEGQGPRTSV